LRISLADLAALTSPDEFLGKDNPGGLNRSTQHFILKERWSVL
jgi:hypothetical protein